MRQKVCVVLQLVLAAACVKSAHAQTPAAHRDAQAVQIVQSALAYLTPASQGGQAVPIQDSKVQGTCTLQSQGNSASPQFAFLWMTQGPEFRYDSTASSQTVSMRSGHGNPVTMTSSATNPLSPATAAASLPYHMPAVVLSEDVGNLSFGILSRGTSTKFAQATANVVDIVQLAGTAPMPSTRQRWYFASGTNQPIAVEYETPAESSPANHVHMLLTYSGFAPQPSGSVTPTGVAISSPVTTSNCTATSTQLNTSPAPSAFDASGAN